jgi:hypothetical protein
MPNELSLPRSVFVADNRLYRAISSDPKSVDLLADDDSMIVPYSARPEVNADAVAAVRKILIGAGQLSPEALLIRNPYDEASYELAEYAIESFASAKYHALANVARLLGATSVSFLEAKVEQTNVAWLAEIKSKLQVAGGDAESSSEIKKRVEDSLEGQLAFAGGDAKVDEAVSYLSRRRLLADQQLNALVEMRSGANPMESYQMTFNGTKEATASFRSALNLANAGPVKALGVGAAFSRTVTSVSRIEIRIKITF